MVTRCEIASQSTISGENGAETQYLGNFRTMGWRSIKLRQSTTLLFLDIKRLQKEDVSFRGEVAI